MYTSRLRLFFRTIFFSITLMGYFLASLLIYFFSGMSFKRARPHLTRVISWTSFLGLRIMGISVKKKSLPNDSKENYLIVSNHLSYLDILIISSSFPTCFVTSKEMKETPFLGQICLLGGCLFVERRKKSGITSEVEELTKALQSGLNVAIFPEATSTNGEGLIPFKRPLFQAALNAKAKILPLCLNYRTLDGEKITIKNRDKVFWYGDMSFFSHALTLFSHQNLVAELTVMEILHPHEFSDKKELSERCYDLLSAEFESINEMN